MIKLRWILQFTKFPCSVPTQVEAKYKNLESKSIDHCSYNHNLGRYTHNCLGSKTKLTSLFLSLSYLSYPSLQCDHKNSTDLYNFYRTVLVFWWARPSCGLVSKWSDVRIKVANFFSKIATAVNTLKVKWVLNNPKNHQDFGYFYEEICHQEF